MRLAWAFRPFYLCFTVIISLLVGDIVPSVVATVRSENENHLVPQLLRQREKECIYSTQVFI